MLYFASSPGFRAICMYIVYALLNSRWESLGMKIALLAWGIAWCIFNGMHPILSALPAQLEYVVSNKYTVEYAQLALENITIIN